MLTLIGLFNAEVSHMFCVYITLPPRTGCGTRLNYKRVAVDLNLDFSFLINCRIKVKEPSLSYHLPIAGASDGVIISKLA